MGFSRKIPSRRINVHTLPYGRWDCQGTGAICFVRSEGQTLSRLASIVHRLGSHAVAIFEKACELSMYEPAGKKFTHNTERQLILNTVGQDASAGALRLHFMGMVPAAEGARNLDVPELPSFDVIAVLEYPPNPEWAHVDAQSSAVAVVDSRCPLYDFNGLPGWC